ncbi:MAG: hypothetical protein JW934_06115 [Anaerolineae bacterium]|nr:hypothetical protein [Anaerolineae bacterium]
MIPDLISIARVKQRYLTELFQSRNVVACGVGLKETDGVLTDEPCIVVSVSQKLPKSQLSAADLVPKMLDSFKTDVQETGVFVAQQADPKQKYRPAIPGISCGHIGVTAGTLGCLVRRGEQVFILSNNHVLANTNKASKGDPIVQPGPYDGGTLDDQIATLEDWVPLQTGVQQPGRSWAKLLADLINSLAKFFGSTNRLNVTRARAIENTVDCAIARPLSSDLVRPEILEIGRPKGISGGALGMKVQKTGRTTGYTTGQITQIDVTVQIDYGGQPVTFVDQWMATRMSAGGDSGSAVLDMQGNVMGLLFAGSDMATLINPIQLVLDALKVELVT